MGVNRKRIEILYLAGDLKVKFCVKVQNVHLRSASRINTDTGIVRITILVKFTIFKISSGYQE